MVDSVVLPKSLFQRNAGFGMDCGSSSIKVVHTTDEGDNLRLHFNSFNKDDLEGALRFVKEECLTDADKDREIAAIGIGAAEQREYISKTLNINLNLEHQSDTGLEAFQFMVKHISWENMFYPPSQTAVEYGSELAKQYATIYTSHSSGKLRPWKYMSDVEGNDQTVRDFKTPQTVQFPHLMVGIGSSLFMGVVNDDASIDGCCNMNAPAGRTFLGLGSLLTGAKDFYELAEMASRGKASNVDQWMHSLISNDDRPIDYKLFAFGHTVDKDLGDFRQEDLAAALVSLIVQSAVNEAYFWAAHHKIQQVLFVGGFSGSTAHIREEIMKEFNLRRFNNSLQHVCDCHIMKQGAHLGAFGVLMKNIAVT